MWQIEKYGNFIGKDGQLHKQPETHHMVYDEEIENGSLQTELALMQAEEMLELELLSFDNL